MVDIDDADRRELLAMVSPEAIRSRLLKRRSLVLALLAGEDLPGVRLGGAEEMLAVLQLRAPLPGLSPEELDAWRGKDPRYEELYRDYETLVALDEAAAEMERGEGRPIEDVLPALRERLGIRRSDDLED